MGQVLQAGAGQITARQAAVKAGIPMTVPALTVNKVCLSGLDAIALADQLIRAGEFEIVVAGGMESMTNAPHLLPGSRAGYKYGTVEMLDAMAHDGLFCAFDNCAMGESTERYNAKLGISREDQDAFSAQSHQRAAAAQKNGIFDEEIVPVEVPQRRGDPIVVKEDEGIRSDTTAELLAKLRPAFAPDGTITAGSSSQISDGGAAVVVMSKAKADELGLEWLAEIGAHGVVAGPDASLQSQPANAIKAALTKDGITVDDLDLVEINEAFASVGIHSTRELGSGRQHRQRQRRRHRDGPPDRHERRPAGAAPRPRAQAPRRRHRRSSSLRRRGTGRRADPARAEGLSGPPPPPGRTSPSWSRAPGRVTRARSRG